MAANYQEFADKTRSSKLTIATVEAKHQRKVFSGGPVYQILTDYFVVGCMVDGVELTESASTPNQGEFQYIADQGIVKLRLDLDENPNGKRVFLKYRMFYSSQPLILSGPLSNDISVEYEPRIGNQPSFKLELDYENTGVMLETTNSLNLENTDGYFDDKFDQFIWEGQKVNVYSWSYELPVSEMKLFYRGKIDAKAFSDRNITFNIRDQITDLREKVPYTVFTDSDGRISDSNLNKPKRKIYGQAESVMTVGCDKVLSGYPVSGTYEGSADRNLLTGVVSGVSLNTHLSDVGTLFLTELNIGDDILIEDGVFQYTYTVASIPNNLTVNITSPVTTTFTNRQARNKEILNNKVFGVGTNFKALFSRDDEIVYFPFGVEKSVAIDEVVSDTELTLGDEIEETFTSMLHNPDAVPYRGYNRKWHIAGHKLRSVTHTITAIIDESTFELDATDEFAVGDTVSILGVYRAIVRITGLNVRLNQSTSFVSISDTLEKIPVPVVYNGLTPLLFGRDYNTVNTSTDAYIELDEKAEFNISKSKNLSIVFNFVNGSDIVTAVSIDRDLATIFKTRDWVITPDITHQIWYEILSVDQLQFRLRVPYAGSSITTALMFRSPDYISDESVITANCLGMEWNGNWVKTPADAVLQMLESINEPEINYQSFADASVDCQYVSSLIIPLNIGEDMPTLKDAITYMNKSCFGSMYFDGDFKFTYKILNSTKPSELKSVSGEDILSFSVQTKNQILGSVILQYRPFTDKTNGESTFKSIRLDSDFVSETSGYKNEATFTSYLYSDEDAQTIAERWKFFRSLSQSVVKIQAKMNFMLTNLSEPVFINLERLFLRYGGNGRKKIGLVNGVEKDGDSTGIVFNDMGNIFNRVPSICEDTQPDYNLSESDDIAKFGFIVDNDTETPDALSELDLGNNLIG